MTEELREKRMTLKYKCIFDEVNNEYNINKPHYHRIIRHDIDTILRCKYSSYGRLEAIDLLLEGRKGRTDYYQAGWVTDCPKKYIVIVGGIR